MRAPDFLVIGAQKSGTTFLYELLKCHPQLFLSTPKESHFFSLHYDKGFEWYSDLFDDAASSQLAGEVTPYYLFHPLASKRIFSDVPNVKLIVLLRDPIARAISHYFHSVRLGLEDLAFFDALMAEDTRLKDAAIDLSIGSPHLSHQQHSYRSRSEYVSQLLAYNCFPSSQFLILKSEDLFAQTAQSLSRIFKFLNVPLWSPSSFAPSYKGHYETSKLPPNVLSFLSASLEPTYSQLALEYGIRWRS